MSFIGEVVLKVKVRRVVSVEATSLAEVEEILKLNKDELIDVLEEEMLGVDSVIEIQGEINEDLTRDD